MRKLNPTETPEAQRAFQRGYLLLAGLQCAAALTITLQTRSENGGVLGLSGFRLLLAVIFLAALLACAGLLAATWLRPERSTQRWKRLSEHWTQPPGWWRLFFASSILFLTGVLFLALAPGFQEPVAIAYAERLSPLIGLVIGLGAQTGAALLIYRRNAGAFGLRPAPRLFFATMLASVAILLAWKWAMDSVGPTEAVRVGWNRMGAPLVEFQVFLAWIASLAWMAFGAWSHRASGRERSKLGWLARPDLWLSILIWAAAVVAWQRVPVEPNWFLMKPFPPNFEFYPSSDARAYDMVAQTALTGDGYLFYGLPYVRRSLLAFYMTVLHLLGGQDYERVVLLQILALALIPVVLYHITKQVHTCAAGVLAAALMIFREANSIRISGNVTTSNVKLLMADLPTVLAACVFALLLIVWLKRLAAATEPTDARLSAQPHVRLCALLCGGGLGLVMLIRLETFVFFGAIALISALILWPRRKIGLWVQHLLTIGLGIGLVLSPWIARNYLRTGQIFIDSPYFFSELLYQRFHPSRDLTPTDVQEPSSWLPATPVTPPSAAPKVALVQPVWQQPTPTPATPAVPAADEGNEQTAELSPSFFISNLGSLIQSAAAHILNSQVQMFLIPPTTWRGFESTLAFTAHRSLPRWQEDCCQAVGYVRALPYWGRWDGSFSFSALWLLLINLAIIAWGAQSAWRRSAWAGMAPLVMALTYIAFNGLLRNSGGRYALPVDWSVLLYFSVGLAQLTNDMAARLLGKAPFDQTVELSSTVAGAPITRRPIATWILASLALLAIGSLPPLLEASIPQRYNSEQVRPMKQQLFQSDLLSAAEKAALQAYIQRGADLTVGRALYPRFFAPNVSDPNGQTEFFEATPYPRITFFLAGRINGDFALPIERRPKKFTNGTDVIAILCPDLDILALALYAPDGVLQDVLLRSPFPPGQTCPLPKGAGDQ